MKKLIITIIVGLFLGGCAQNRLPKPANLPEVITHHYVITAKNQDDNPVEGVRIQSVKTDLSTVFTHDNPVKNYETKITDSLGVAGFQIKVQLSQHWKGGYYQLENEAEIARQSYPHGGTDIWGYFTDFRSDVFNSSKFTLGNNLDERIDARILVKTPPTYGRPGQHKYNFQAFNKSGRPIVGARVFATVSDHSKSNGDPKKIKKAEQHTDCITDEKGACSITVPVSFGTYYASDYPTRAGYTPFDWLYKSNLPGLYFGYFSAGTVFAAMPGFFETERVEIDRASYSGLEPDQTPIKITVPQPSDYFCDRLKAPDSAKFSTILDAWVRAIRVTSWTQKAELKDICIEEYKGKFFVTTTLEHKIKYNELKLNNYGIGVLVFDEVVRKMLKPVASASKDIPVEGLKISIQTLKSNFIEKSSPGELLKFDFYMPKVQTLRYIDADISGQKLIDNSIVLLNDERIDIELK